MPYLVQAITALALLIGLPMVLEAPSSTEGLLAAAVGALVLVALAFQGITRFVRSRRPRVYPDSVMPPRK